MLFLACPAPLFRHCKNQPVAVPMGRLYLFLFVVHFLGALSLVALFFIEFFVALLVAFPLPQPYLR